VLFAFPLLQISFNVKVGEQRHHNKSIAKHDPFCPVGIFAIVVQYGSDTRYSYHSKLRLENKSREKMAITTQNSTRNTA